MGVSRKLKHRDSIVLVDDDTGQEVGRVLMVGLGRGKVVVNVHAPQNIEIVFLKDGEALELDSNDKDD